MCGFYGILLNYDRPVNEEHDKRLNNLAITLQNICTWIARKHEKNIECSLLKTPRFLVFVDNRFKMTGEDRSTLNLINSKGFFHVDRSTLKGINALLLKISEEVEKTL